MRDQQQLARVVRFALAVLLAVVTVPLGPAPPAHAHAGLVSTEPTQNSVIGYSPTEAVLTFTEPVRPVASRIQVIAPDGKRINNGEPTTDGPKLIIPMRVADRPLGTYLVSYRVISADSHPVSGAFTFSVGAPSASAPSADDLGVHPVVAVAVPTAKFVGYAGLTLAFGTALVLALLWPRRAPRATAVRLVRGGLVAVAVGTAGTFWLQAPYSSGAGPLNVSLTELGQVLATPAGMALVARLGLLAAAAAMIRPLLRGERRIERWRGWALAALAVLGAMTWPLAGHALAAQMPPLAVLADTLHVLAMALWLGGLVALVLLLRRTHPRVLARVLPVWSRWAALAVCWLALAGVVQALPEVGSLEALISTLYGQLLLAKIGLLALVLGVAALARRGVRRGTPELVRRAVRVELVGTVLVLAATSVLVNTTPARVALMEAREAALDGFSQTLESSIYTLQFEIYPVQLGDNNTVHAYVYTPQGEPQSVVEWKLSATLPERDIGPTFTQLLGVEPHHGMGSITFPLPGEWELRFTLRISEIDQATVSTKVKVR